MIIPRKIMPTNGEGAAATVEWGRLIEAVATRRDRAAFVALFEHFAPRVKTFALRSGVSAATAEELAQETMLTVWRKADLFVAGSHGAAAWIFTIARNLRIDALRRERRNGCQVDIDWETAIESRVDGQLTPESQVAAVQLEHCVRKAMGRLSNEQLRVIELSFFGTVKSRSRLAITRLRALLGEMCSSRSRLARLTKRSALKPPRMSVNAQVAMLSCAQWSMSAALCLTVCHRRHWPTDQWLR